MNRTIAIAEAATTPATTPGLLVSSASGRRSAATSQTIAPARNGQELRKLFDEEERGDCHQRLGKAREDAPGGRCARCRPARHENKADRESLRDVVHSDRQADEDPQVLLHAEGDAYADTFREGVDRHDPDDQECLRRVGSLERPQMQRLVGVDDSLRDEDEDGAGKDTYSRALRSVPGSLDDETEARTEHQPGGEPVRDTEPVTPGTTAEEERERAQTRRECRQQCDGKDSEGIHRLSNVTSPEEAAWA